MRCSATLPIHEHSRLRFHRFDRFQHPRRCVVTIPPLLHRALTSYVWVCNTLQTAVCTSDAGRVCVIVYAEQLVEVTWRSEGQIGVSGLDLLYHTRS